MLSIVALPSSLLPPRSKDSRSNWTLSHKCEDHTLLPWSYTTRDAGKSVALIRGNDDDYVTFRVQDFRHMHANDLRKLEQIFPYQPGVAGVIWGLLHGFTFFSQP